MTATHRTALNAAAVLWVLWGLVHSFAGVMTILQEPSQGFAAIADAIEAALLAHTDHPAVGGMLNQHGWNLLWFGVATVIGAVFIWRRNMTAIWVTAMVGGLADLGYFLFLDIPGHVNIVPGTIMTLISSTAIVLSGWVWLASRQSAVAALPWTRVRASNSVATPSATVLSIWVGRVTPADCPGPPDGISRLSRAHEPCLSVRVGIAMGRRWVGGGEEVAERWNGDG